MKWSSSNKFWIFLAKDITKLRNLIYLLTFVFDRSLDGGLLHHWLVSLAAAILLSLHPHIGVLPLHASLLALPRPSKLGHVLTVVAVPPHALVAHAAPLGPGLPRPKHPHGCRPKKKTILISIKISPKPTWLTRKSASLRSVSSPIGIIPSGGTIVDHIHEGVVCLAAHPWGSTQHSQCPVNAFSLPSNPAFHQLLMGPQSYTSTLSSRPGSSQVRYPEKNISLFLSMRPVAKGTTWPALSYTVYPVSFYWGMESSTTEIPLFVERQLGVGHPDGLLNSPLWWVSRLSTSCLQVPHLAMETLSASTFTFVSPLATMSQSAINFFSI